MEPRLNFCKAGPTRTASSGVRSAQRDLNPPQYKNTGRLPKAGNSEPGGMTTDKYATITGASKATAAQD